MPFIKNKFKNLNTYFINRFPINYLVYDPSLERYSSLKPLFSKAMQGREENHYLKYIYQTIGKN